MRLSLMLICAGITMNQFRNYRRRNQLPFTCDAEFYQNEEMSESIAKHANYSVSDAENLRVMQTLIGEHGMPPGLAANAAARFFGPVMTISPDNCRSCSPEGGDIFGIYFTWEDPIEVPGHDGQTYGRGNLNEVGTILNRLSEGSKTYRVKSVVMVNLTEAARATIAAALATNPEILNAVT